MCKWFTPSTHRLQSESIRALIKHSCVAYINGTRTWLILPMNMMTSSNGNIFRVTGPLWREFTGPGEFPTRRPVTRSFDVFFDMRLYKRLSIQPWGWWFETPSWSLWRQCDIDVLTHNSAKLPDRAFSLTWVNFNPSTEKQSHAQ